MSLGLPCTCECSSEPCAGCVRRKAAARALFDGCVQRDAREPRREPYPFDADRYDGRPFNPDDYAERNHG